MEKTKFTVNIENTSHRDAPLSGADDFSVFNSQLFTLLLKYNNDKCIYKYKFSLNIYSDNVTFDQIGQITPSNDIEFFNTHNIRSCNINSHYNKRELTWSHQKAIHIFFNNIKFYKRFRNFQPLLNTVTREVKSELECLKSKGIIKLDVIVVLSCR
jgi:hypothetical protein